MVETPTPIGVEWAEPEYEFPHVHVSGGYPAEVDYEPGPLEIRANTSIPAPPPPTPWWRSFFARWFGELVP
jgi:hypothetical protein